MILFAWKGDHERLVTGRLRHQPDAEFGDDAEIRLGEHAIELRSEPMFADLPMLAVRDASLARANDLAIGKHNFNPALHNEVIAIGRVAGAMLERVPHDAAHGGRSEERRGGKEGGRRWSTR